MPDAPTTAMPPPTAPADLVSGYRPVEGLQDAMVGTGGTVTPGWGPLADRLRAASPQMIDRRHDQALRIIDDNGIPHADPETDHRPWTLDPIPFQIDTAGFQQLAGALSQRAALLNQLVVDLLGEQRCLREKILPPALLFANPYYRRAYHDLPVAGGRYLHIFGSDVFLGADGRWWSTNDITRSPSGLGFMIENRVAIARVHADWFDALNIQRLTGSLATLRSTLAEIAPREVRNPRIVVLGHNPEEPRGFEDEFLARYLGFTFAVGEDIVVRKGQAVLRTLGGAAPIDVILRRIQDDRCDPVELSPASTEGVAGLVDAQRREEVSIANMLGTQLAEAPGLLAFLDPLCRFYFGEELSLPSVPTWWCGQRDAREHVLANLGTILVRSAFDPQEEPTDGRMLSEAERSELAGRIKANPERFAAQRPAALTTSPAWTGGTLNPALWTMRAFAVLNGDRYDAVPGGVVRLPSDASASTTETTAKGRVQDCWVHAEGPVDAPKIAASGTNAIHISRAGTELPSRVAEKLYWIGRRIEAFEHQARLLRSLLNRATDELPDTQSTPAGHPWLRFFALVPGLSGVTPESARTAAAGAVAAAIPAAAPPSGLGVELAGAVRAARAIRDRMSADAWRLINQAERRLRAAARSPDAQNVLDDLEIFDVATLLDESILDAAAFAGLMSESMTRTLAWRFLDMGRRIERAMGLARLIATGLTQPSGDETSTLAFVLEVADSTMTYRSRYLADIRFAAVLDLLLIDESNPRSIAFQLATLAGHLEHLPRGDAGRPLDDDQRIAVRLLDRARLAEVDPLGETDGSGVRATLAAHCASVTDELPLAERAFSARYLVHAAVPKQFLHISSARPTEPVPPTGLPDPPGPGTTEGTEP